MGERCLQKIVKVLQCNSKVVAKYDTCINQSFAGLSFGMSVDYIINMIKEEMWKRKKK